MLTKIYWYSWLTTIAAFLALFAAGSMSIEAWIVFGFVAFGLVFIGMIAVLPTSVTHPRTATEPTGSKLSPKPVTHSIQHSVRSVRV